MIGEISIGGVYIPTLIVFVCAAILVVTFAFRLLATTGFYALVTYRPVTDVALFILVLAAIVWVTESWGLRT